MVKGIQVTDKHIEIIPEIFIENVRKALDFYGYKQKDLINLAQLSSVTISKLLSNNEEYRMKEPPLQTVARVCIALNMNMNIAVLKRVTNVVELFNHHIPRAQMNDENRQSFENADRLAKTIYADRELKVNRENPEGDFNYTNLVMQLFDIHVYAKKELGKERVSFEEAINFMEKMKA